MQQLPMGEKDSGVGGCGEQLKFITLILHLFHFNLSLKCQNY